MTDKPETLRLSRILPAAPEAVFAAWTDPASLSQWFDPGGVSVTLAEIDARVGGRLVINMRGNESGRDFPHDGEFLEVDPPRRLVFTWRTPWEQESRVTLELVPHEGGTELTLIHERIPNAELRDSYQGGWTRVLESLEGHLARAAA